MGSTVSTTGTAAQWEAAFAEWLAENPQTGAPRPRATVQAYRGAWADFRQFCPKDFWDVTGLDVKLWVDDLKQRPVRAYVRQGLERNGRRQPGQLGLSPATINQWVTALSAFYSFCERYDVLDDAGRCVPLFQGMNPAKNRMVKRPRKAQDDVLYLTPEQLRDLLAAIVAFQERNRAKGLRDYALVLCYIATGGRNSEVRTWRWRDIERRGATMFYRWANKGKAGTDELPADAWAAVQDYLQQTGRLAGIGPDDYIFTPHGDAATRFRRADGTALIAPDDWTCNRPLSSQEVNRCLRQYARLAGIPEARLHVHCLRHSAYMLYREAGMSLEERSKLLHHANLTITTIYDHRIAGQRNMGWEKAAALLGIGQATEQGS